MRTLYLLGCAHLALSLFALWRGPLPARPYAAPGGGAVVVASGTDAVAWFAGIRPSCNALEVAMAQDLRPAPATVDGAGYAAACWALAGRMTEARDRIRALDTEQRWRAAGIVFDVGHPIADMGDDRSAGPIMELVVEFWPNHYMALYHAGAARYALGDLGAAEPHLREFLVLYRQDDGWTANARRMLADMKRP